MPKPTVSPAPHHRVATDLDALAQLGVTPQGGAVGPGRRAARAPGRDRRAMAAVVDMADPPLRRPSRGVAAVISATGAAHGPALVGRSDVRVAMASMMVNVGDRSGGCDMGMVAPVVMMDAGLSRRRGGA